MTSVKLINHSSSTADWNNYAIKCKHFFDFDFFFLEEGVF